MQKRRKKKPTTSTNKVLPAVWYMDLMESAQLEFPNHRLSVTMVLNQKFRMGTFAKNQMSAQTRKGKVNLWLYTTKTRLGHQGISKSKRKVKIWLAHQN